MARRLRVSAQLNPSDSSLLRSFFVNCLFGPFSSKSMRSLRASALASCACDRRRAREGRGRVSQRRRRRAKKHRLDFSSFSKRRPTTESSVREGKKTQEPRGKNLGKSRATFPAFRADSASVGFRGRDARTFAALLAAFFSCFSRSTAAMISICVKGRFSRFFALPLFRIPSPNSTWLCSGCAKVNRGDGERRGLRKRRMTRRRERARTRRAIARARARSGEGEGSASRSRNLAISRAGDVPGSPVSPAGGWG